jgi:hypothetical protein
MMTVALQNDLKCSPDRKKNQAKFEKLEANPTGKLVYNIVTFASGPVARKTSLDLELPLTLPKKQDLYQKHTTHRALVVFIGPANSSSD